MPEKLKWKLIISGWDQIGYSSDCGNNKKTAIGVPVIGNSHKKPTSRSCRKNEKVNVGYQEHRPWVG